MTLPSGAPTPVRSDRQRPWLIAGVVVVVVLIFMFLSLSRCGDDPPAATSTGSSAPARTSSSAASSDSAPATNSAQADSPDAGRLTAGDTVLVPRSAETSGSDLSAYVGRRADASAISVLSVPADEGFWVGTSPLDRTWVQITGTSESPFKVRTGQKVSFTGTVVAHGSDFPDQVGVNALEGSAQLVAERAHIQVSRAALVFAS